MVQKVPLNDHTHKYLFINCKHGKKNWKLNELYCWYKQITNVKMWAALTLTTPTELSISNTPITSSAAPRVITFVPPATIWSSPSEPCTRLISVCVRWTLVAGLPAVPNTSFPCGVPRQCHNRPANPHFLILVCLRSIHRERIMALFSDGWTGVCVSCFLWLFHRYWTVGLHCSRSVWVC